MALIFHIPRLRSRLRRLMNKHVRAAARLLCRDYSSGGAGGKRVWVFKNKDVLVIGLPSLRAAHRAATLPRSLSFFFSHFSIQQSGSCRARQRAASSGFGRSVVPLASDATAENPDVGALDGQVGESHSSPHVALYTGGHAAGESWRGM